MKNHIINIIGIDGSGKTTISNILLAKLKEKKYIYRWSKFESYILKYAININNNFIKNDHIKNKNKNRFNNKYVALFYEMFVIIVYSIHIFFKIKIPMIMGYNIICDRYTIDTIVDISYDLSISDNHQKKLYKLFQLIYPKPKYIFYIDISPEIAFSRKNDIPSHDFLIKKKNIYENLLKYNGDIVRVDGSKDIDSLLNAIFSKIEVD